MFNNQLALAKEEGKAISIFIDENNTKHFFCGFVRAYSAEFFLLDSALRNGLYDGYVLQRNEQIYRTNIDGNYERKIEQLYRLQNQSHALVELKSGNLIVDLLTHALKNALVVFIELCDSGRCDVQGFVQAIDEDIVSISCLTDNGEADGDTIILLSGITYICCDSDEEMAIRLLAQSKRK